MINIKEVVRFMKRVIFVLTVLFVFSTAISTIAGDSVSIPGWDWTGILNNPVGGGQLKSARFITPGTYSWTAPAGITAIWLTMCGGGGGGGVYNAWNGGGGGGAGEGFYRRLVAVTPGTAYTVVVGAGGAGATYGVSTWGSDGGNSSFGGYVARGGKGNRAYGACLNPYVCSGSDNGCGGIGASYYWGTAATPGAPHPVFKSVTGAVGGQLCSLSFCGSGLSGGGGGGGWGDGGSGEYDNGGNGGYCAGGGGSYNAVNGVKGGNGGPGLVMIEWFE